MCVWRGEGRVDGCGAQANNCEKIDETERHREEEEEEEEAEEEEEEEGGGVHDAGSMGRTITRRLKKEGRVSEGEHLSNAEKTAYSFEDQC